MEEILSDDEKGLKIFKEIVSRKKKEKQKDWREDGEIAS